MRVVLRLALSLTENRKVSFSFKEHTTPPSSVIAFGADSFPRIHRENHEVALEHPHTNYPKGATL